MPVSRRFRGPLQVHMSAIVRRSTGSMRQDVPQICENKHGVVPGSFDWKTRCLRLSRRCSLTRVVTPASKLHKRMGFLEVLIDSLATRSLGHSRRHGPLAVKLCWQRMNHSLRKLSLRFRSWTLTVTPKVSLSMMSAPTVLSLPTEGSPSAIAC